MSLDFTSIGTRKREISISLIGGGRDMKNSIDRIEVHLNFHCLTFHLVSKYPVPFPRLLRLQLAASLVSLLCTILGEKPEFCLFAGLLPSTNHGSVLLFLCFHAPLMLPWRGQNIILQREAHCRSTRHKEVGGSLI